MNDSSATPRLLHEGEFLRLLRRRHWEYVERTNARGVAVMVAVTADAELLLVEQYRLPVARPWSALRPAPPYARRGSRFPR